MAAASGLSFPQNREPGSVEPNPACPTTDVPTSPQFLIRSTQKVIDHYRRVLTTHPMSETEQETIRTRLAQQERLLNDLQVSYARPTKEGILEAA
jgi:hypothetical protein